MVCLFFVSFHAQSTIDITNVVVSSPNQCDGSIELIASGTAGPFDVTISNQSGYFSFYEDVNGILLIDNLCPGEYFIDVEHQFGCAISLTAIVGVSDHPWITKFELISFDNGTAYTVLQRDLVDNRFSVCPEPRFAQRITLDDRVNMLNSGAVIRIECSKPVNFVHVSIPLINQNSIYGTNLGGNSSFEWQFLSNVFTFDCFGASQVFDCTFIAEDDEHRPLINLYAQSSSFSHCINKPSSNGISWIPTNEVGKEIHYFYTDPHTWDILETEFVDLACGQNNTGSWEVSTLQQPAQELYPFTFEWSTGVTNVINNYPSNPIDHLEIFESGTATVTITDNPAGCNQTLAAYFQGNLEINTEDVTNFCGNSGAGTIEISVHGQANQLSFDWDGGLVSSTYSIGNIVYSEVTDLAAGNYCLTVSSSSNSNCQDVACFTIENDLPEI